MNHNHIEEYSKINDNNFEEFSFISNAKYFDQKMNLKSKPIFLIQKNIFPKSNNNTKKYTLNESSIIENEGKLKLIKMNFFNERNLNQGKIKIKSYLI